MCAFALWATSVFHLRTRFAGPARQQAWGSARKGIRYRHAKANGRRNVQFYAATISAALQARLKLENDLHLALSHNELELYYQPRVEFSTTQVVGYEALLRWNHPQDGLIQPDVFIPIAEDCGLIMPIGE